MKHASFVGATSSDRFPSAMDIGAIAEKDAEATEESWEQTAWPTGEETGWQGEEGEDSLNYMGKGTGKGKGR